MEKQALKFKVGDVVTYIGKIPKFARKTYTIEYAGPTGNTYILSNGFIAREENLIKVSKLSMVLE